MTDWLWPHGLQHIRLPCPSPSPGVCSNSCPLSGWCLPTISSSLVPSPPAFSLSSIRVFSSELALCSRWPKYQSFSFSISPSNEYLKLISSRIEWFDLLTSVHDYCTKNIALTIWTFVGKMMSVPFNMLSKFVIVFLPRTRHLLISWLQSWSTVILEPKEVKSVTLSIS